MNKIAILVDHNDQYPPSNCGAMNKFSEAALEVGLTPLIVEGNRPDLIEPCDALFIRTTTNAFDYTYQLSSMMESNNKPVIDSTHSIMHGGNKVYIHNESIRLGFPTPKTQIVSGPEDFENITQFPAVVKPVYECFSKNIFLAEKMSDMDQVTKFPVVVQEFMYTPFDWRIGVLEGRVIYACKYYMAPDYWKVIDYSKFNGEGFGDTQCVAINEVPENVKNLALQASIKCYGNDLYGVDIKEKDGKCYLIEVNDNPSIESNIEDCINEDIYFNIMNCFKRRIYSISEISA